MRSVGLQADMRGNARSNRRRGARTGMYFGIVWNIERMVARRGRGKKKREIEGQEKLHSERDRMSKKVRNPEQAGPAYEVINLIFE